MGMRLSLCVLPKSVERSLWLVSDYESCYEVTKDLERIAYDFCTDAMWDVEADKSLKKKMKRLTRSRLDIEEDIVIGKMDKVGFMTFMERVKWHAERQITESDKPLVYWPYINESGDPWRLCSSMDWIGAYFNCWYILKRMDWNENYILYEIGSVTHH